jgi:hypothetical protein
MGPRERKRPPDPDAAASQERKLTELRERLAAAGVNSKRLAVLLTVANTKGGLGPVATMLRRIRLERQAALAALRSQELSAHRELHRLLDDPDETDCDPRKNVTCLSKVDLVQQHFWFCRALLRARREGDGKRVFPVTRLGDVITILVRAGLKKSEIALLAVDHAQRERKPGTPLAEAAIIARQHAIHEAASAHKRRERKKRTDSKRGTPKAVEPTTPQVGRPRSSKRS